MNYYENQIKKRALLQQASNNSVQAGTQFNQTQLDVNKDRIVSAEKAGWWAGASASLSFTLVGYIISNQELRVLLGQEIFSNFLLVYFLIIGLMSFLLSIIGSVLCRLFNSTYLNYSSANYWASTEVKLRALQLDWIINGYDFLPSGDESVDQAHKNIKESKDSYENLENTANKRKNYNLKFVNYSIATTFAGLIIGFICITIFYMIVVFKLSII